jgi:hypothetical protein
MGRGGPEGELPFVASPEVLLGHKTTSWCVLQLKRAVQSIVYHNCMHGVLFDQ